MKQSQPKQPNPSHQVTVEDLVKAKPANGFQLYYRSLVRHHFMPLFKPTSLVIIALYISMFVQSSRLNSGPLPGHPSPLSYVVAVVIGLGALLFYPVIYNAGLEGQTVLQWLMFGKSIKQAETEAQAAYDRVGPKVTEEYVGSYHLRTTVSTEKAKEARADVRWKYLGRLFLHALMRLVLALFSFILGPLMLATNSDFGMF